MILFSFYETNFSSIYAVTVEIGVLLKKKSESACVSIFYSISRGSGGDLMGNDGTTWVTAV